MLVLLSDVHLTDGTSGDTIQPGAFEKFSEYLQRMAAKAEAREVEIVFLGDIFDLIRSAAWLDTTCRPWSPEDAADSKGKVLKDYAVEITHAICSRPDNAQCARHLADLRAALEQNGICATFGYVPGNHDWLVNRYGATRQMAADFLGVAALSGGEPEAFPLERLWPEYAVFARHGDSLDPFNYDGPRDASSLGDAFVIDLLNRLPWAVEKEIGQADPGLVRLLREVDNVRPLLDVPLWVEGACRQAATPDIGRRVKQIWDGLVDDFLRMPFVTQHDRWGRWDPVDTLGLGLRLSRLASLGDLAAMARQKALQVLGGGENLADFANAESAVREDRADFVVYGHTHQYDIRPLAYPLAGQPLMLKSYVNTGTWRRVHERSDFEPTGRLFSSWDVMTFVCFYLDNERGTRLFEVWNGALA